MNRIDLNVVATGNFAQLESQLSRLKAQVASINAAMSTSAMINPSAISNMQKYSDLMSQQLRSTGMFQTQMVSLTSETERFGKSLERGNVRLGDYFRTATGYIRNQQTEIQRLAREQVRLANSTSLAMGDGRAMVITPTGIDEAIHKQQILNQEYRIFRQVVQGGSTQLINWGKNTQWAGRQLTVGLTVPLTIFGAAAAKTFMEADKQLTRLAKVYGDASKGMVDPGELDAIRQQTLGLAQEIASSMGVAAEETLGIAADIAATGAQGNELLAATNEAMRLSVLGEVDRQEAMKATLSIQSVFKKDTEGLTESINFLNAVENQTSTSLDDLTVGIVKAGPVVEGLGGSIEDLALMMVAMREGGVPASEAANAIKSSLASLINPTKQTTQVLNAFGVDLVSIVDKNAGDVIGTLVDLQGALSGLDELSRQRAIEQIFGKFQFSRINALLSNLGRAGSQTEQVLALAGMSVQDLAANADKELKAVTESVTGRFQRALASLQANLIPIGEIFTEVGTLFLNVANKILEIFNSLPEPVKKFVQGLLFLTGLAGPIIMIAGVFGNFLGYLLKGVSSLMALKRAGRGVFEYFTPESIAARDASELITQAVYDEKTAIETLNAALEKLNKTLIEMQANSTAAAQSMQGMASQTMAEAEAAAIESSYFRRSGDRLEGGVFSHRFPKSQMEEETAGLVAGSGTLQPSGDLGSRFDKINNAIGQRFVSVVADGMSEESTRAIEELRAHINERVRGGMTPQEEARVFQTKEAYLSETSGQLLYPQVASKMLGAGVDPKILRESQQKFMAEIVAEGPQVAIANLRELASKHSIDLDKELSLTFDKLQATFDRTMEETGGNVRASMEAVSKAANEMELEAKTALNDAGLAFRTGKEVKKGDGISRGGTAVQLAMGEYYGLNPEIVQKVEASSLRRINAENQVIEAERRLAATDQRLSQMSIEELSVINKDIDSREIQYAMRRKMAKKQEAYARIEGKWYQVLQNGTVELAKGTAHQKKLSILLEQKMIAERRLIVANARLERLKTEEARASQLAAQADLEEAEASLRAAQADLAEASSSGAATAGVVGPGARRGIRGRLAGGAGIGALGALSAASMFVPVGEEGSGLSQAMNVVGGVGMGASMGAMVGSVVPGIGTAIGAAVGGVIGGIAPVISIFSENSEKAARAMEELRLSAEAASGALSQTEQSFLGIDVKELEDIPLEAFGEKTAEAQSQLDQFKESLIAAKDAQEPSLEKSRIEAFAGMGTAEELINSSDFQNMIFQATVGGASKDQIALMLEGYLDVADKESFSERVTQYLDQTIPDDKDANAVAADYVNKLIAANDSITNKALQGGSPKAGSALGVMMQRSREFEDVRAGRNISFAGKENASYLDIISGLQKDANVMGLVQGGTADLLLNQYQTGQLTDEQITRGSVSGPQGALLGALQGITINGETADPQFIMQILSGLTQITALEPDVQNLAGSMNQFQQNVSDTANSITTLLANGSDLKGFESSLAGIENLENIDPAVITEISSQLNNMGEQGPAVSDFFDGLIASGVDLEIALKAVRLLLSGSITDVEELKTLAQDPIEFNIRYKEIYTGTVGGIYRPGGITSMENMPDASGLASAATEALSGGGGGGGGSDTSAIEDKYDEQIKQQDKIIKNIQKEREERQKLFDLQQKSLNFALKEQGLKNQIARAKAEGNLAEAALLQAQLDIETAAKDREEEERKRQEREDRRIKAAEREKKKLERQKQEEIDAAQGGGGGGAAGPSEEEVKRIEKRVNYLQGVLSQSLVKFGRDIEADIMVEGLGGFFDSKPIQDFKKEMLKLGVPIEDVTEYLDQVYDEFIKETKLVETEQFKAVENGLEKIGLQGEELQDVLPNAFAIIQDRDLTSTEKIDEIAKAFFESGMDADEAKIKAKRFYDQVGDTGDLGGKISKIADAYYEAADAAKKAAFEIAVLNIVTENPKISIADAASAVLLDQAKFGRYNGGLIFGPGGPTDDKILVRLSNGEYVIKASSVDKYGVPFLNALNEGILPMMAGGGMASRYPTAASRMANGGYVYRGMDSGGLVNGSSTEYNIEVNVAGSNASPDDIATEVIRAIERKNRMNGATIRI